jgi:subtilase family serine protease
MVTLPGQIHHKAKAQYDQGRVPASLQMNQLTLLTLPTPAQQKALSLLVAQQQDPKSPNFHQWLTPEQWADRFGLSQNDIEKITTWLKSQGLSVQNVARGRNWVTLSGTADQIEDAFHTEIHHYNVNGEIHYANATAPSIPTALSGIVTGIRGLDDFLPRPNVRKNTAKARKARPNYYDSSFQEDFVAPGDIETIYDLTPLYNAGINGAGQKLAIIGETDVYLADLNDFRSGFGLPAITGCTTNASGIITSCTTSSTANFQYVVPKGITDLGAPSTCDDLVEADLDLEWSAAIVPGAQIIYVNAPATFNSPTCTEILNNGGVDVAYYYAIDNDLAPVISMSYGAPCEFDDNFVSADEIELTKANSFGITFMNASGDSGPASCDPGIDPSTNNLAVGGIAVSYPASSPEVTAVGGTAISYPSGFSSFYWSTPSTNPTNGGTAQNPPLPEIAWNDDEELALAYGGTVLSQQEGYQISASGGGASNCSVQTSNNLSCVSGFPQPSWQTVTIPGGQASARFVPDVSLLASPNFPGYIFCTPLDQWIHSTSSASSCAPGNAIGITNALALTDPGSDPPNESAPTVVGGTSASSPIFAAIVVMLNQYLGANGLGNINPMLYTLAKNPSNGAFRPITSGDNDVYCEGGTPSGFPPAYLCPGTDGSIGLIGFEASNADSATGYNLVTGLGSIDANKLFTAWLATRAGSSIAITPSAASVNQGASVTFTATVTPSTAVGTVSFSTLNNGITTVLGTAVLNHPITLPTGTATFLTTALPSGTNNVSATFEGDGSENASTSTATTVTVTSPDFTFVAGTLTPASVPAGQSASAILTITPVNGSTQTINFTAASCSGLPAGTSCSFNPTSVGPLDGTDAETTILTITTAPNMALPSGPQTITVTATPSGIAGPSHTANVSLTVTPTTETFSLSTTSGAGTFTVGVGGKVGIGITVNSTTGFIVGTGAGATTALPLTYTCSGIPSLPTSEIGCQISPGNGQPTNATAVTVTLQTTAPTSQLHSPLGGRRIFYALLLPGLFGIVFAVGSRTRGLRLLSLIVVLGFSTLWLGSCGGGSSSNTNPPNPGTPQGTYTVTIGATTGGAVPITNSNVPFTVQLVVN